MPLPWDADGGNSCDAADQALADDYRKRYNELLRAKEEQDIVKRELRDAMCCLAEHMGLVDAALAPYLTSPPAPFTSAEGHRFYLRHMAQSIAHVHRRLAEQAAALGMQEYPRVDENLVSALCDPVPRTTGLDSDASSSGDDFEEVTSGEEEDFSDDESGDDGAK